MIDIGAGERSAVIQGLTNGTAYYFNVRARNALGDSQAATTNIVTPMADDQAGDENLWGVDSYSMIGAQILQDVRETYGDPQLWGRYLGTQDYSDKSLEQSEVLLAEEAGIALGLFYFNFDLEYPLVGYERGRELAEEAVTLAEGTYDGPGSPPAPAGTAIVVDVEPNTPEVDSDFIRGWFDVLIESPYRPGYYGDPDDADTAGPGQSFEQAFCEAVDAQPEVADSLLWSYRPNLTTLEEDGRTGPADAPPYGPAVPPCGEEPEAWQYAINPPEDDSPPVMDTNLVRANMGLWYPS